MVNFYAAALAAQIWHFAAGSARLDVWTDRISLVCPRARSPRPSPRSRTPIPLTVVNASRPLSRCASRNSDSIRESDARTIEEMKKYFLGQLVSIPEPESFFFPPPEAVEEIPRTRRPRAMSLGGPPVRTDSSEPNWHQDNWIEVQKVYFQSQVCLEWHLTQFQFLHAGHTFETTVGAIKLKLQGVKNVVLKGSEGAAGEHIQRVVKKKWIIMHKVFLGM